MAHQALDLPAITDDHRQRAFVILAMRNCSFSAAMQDHARARIIEVCASKLRTDDWLRTQARSVVPVRRVRLGADGHPMGWCTQMASGPLVPELQSNLFSTSP